MSTSADEPDPTEEPVDWDNFMRNVEFLENATSAVTRPPRRPADRVLPDTDDVGDLEAKVASLSDAESDDEKVAALREVTRWLAQWKF